MNPLVLMDPTCRMNRKAVRLEMECDNKWVLIDLPKKYKGHTTGQVRLSVVYAERCLDKPAIKAMIDWLTEAMELLPDV